jgi:hypothetical protein
MKHYIIIEVREPDTPRSVVYATDAGFLRQTIHQIATERELDIADQLIREDRPFLFGSHELTPYQQVHLTFRAAMGQSWRDRHPE